MTPRPSWVLLRGLTRDSRHWAGFAPSFERALQTVHPCARVHLLDLPGNGTLNRIDSPTDVTALAMHARAQLAERGVMPPYHLMAMSLGAMVAVAWAHRHPDEVAAGVLINTSLRPYSPPHRRLRPRAFWSLLRLACADAAMHRTEPVHGALAWESEILRLTSRTWRSEEPAGQVLLRQWAAWRQEQPVSGANACRQLWAALRYQAPPVAPPGRWLLLAAARDQLVHPVCSGALARAWQQPLLVHPTAGHDLPLDDPDWVVAQVRQWVMSEEGR